MLQNHTDTAFFVIGITSMEFRFCDDWQRSMFCNFKSILKTSNSTTDNSKVKFSLLSCHWTGILELDLDIFALHVQVRPLEVDDSAFACCTCHPSLQYFFINNSSSSSA